MTAPIVTAIQGHWDNGEDVVSMEAIAVGRRYGSGPMTLISLTDADGEPIGDATEFGWTEQEVVGALEVEEERLAMAQDALAREARRSPETLLLPYVPPEVAP